MRSSRISNFAFALVIVAFAAGCGGSAYLSTDDAVIDHGLIVPPTPPTTGAMLEDKQVGLEVGLSSGYVRERQESVLNGASGNAVAMTRFHGSITFGVYRALNLQVGVDASSGYWGQAASQSLKLRSLEGRTSFAFFAKARTNFVQKGNARAGLDLGFRLTYLPYLRWRAETEVDGQPSNWRVDESNGEVGSVRPLIGIFGGTTIQKRWWIAGGVHSELIENFYGYQRSEGKCGDAWSAECDESNDDNSRLYRPQLAVTPFIEASMLTEIIDATLTIFSSTTFTGDTVIPIGGKFSVRFVLGRARTARRQGLQAPAPVSPTQ